MQKDISLSHGNAKRFPRMLPIYDRNIIPDYNGEGFDSVDSQEFDYPHGCTVKPEYRIIPDPPEFTIELLEKLISRPANTTLGKMWQDSYRERLKELKAAI